MPTRANRIVLRELGTLFNQGAIGDLTDGQLLERFATHDPEAAELAFAALVERHGPMVFRVCKSVLRDRNDADDAFQATLLVLVQKARSLWIKDSLGPWLHRVAHRTATHARRNKSLRREHERRWAIMRPSFSGERDSRDDEAAVLHQEIDRLADRHRIPIVICDPQGLTHEKAARHLGWPVGTVKSRLAKAREILRGRLSRRGLTLYDGTLAAIKGATAASRSIDFTLPPSLAEATVRAAAALAAGKGAKAVSATVTILLAEGLKTMFVNKLKLASVTLVFLGAAAATTVGVLAQSGNRHKPIPLIPANEPEGPDARRDRENDPSRARESAPAYITQSRAMIVTRLEEELAEARARLDRTLGKVRSPDDPAVLHARKTVDALERVLGRIDAVLVEAVETYPTMFDFSGGPAAASGNDMAPVLAPRRELATTNNLRAGQSIEDQLTGARERLGWAEKMYRKGYVSKSVLEQERQNVQRLTSALESEQRSQLLDPGQLMMNMGGMQSQSRSPMTGMGSAANQQQGKGTDIRNANRRPEDGMDSAQNQTDHQQSGQSQGQPQNGRPEAGQDKRQNQRQSSQSGQNQPQPENQQRKAGQSQAQDRSQQQQSRNSQETPSQNQNPSGGQSNSPKQGQWRDDSTEAQGNQRSQDQRPGEQRQSSDDSTGANGNQPSQTQGNGSNQNRNNSANPDRNDQS